MPAPRRLYHVVAINERTGATEILTGYPVPHDKACRILSRQTPHNYVRKQLEELTGEPYTVGPGRCIHFGGQPCFVLKRDGYMPPVEADAAVRRIVRLLNEAHARGEE